MCMMYIAYDKLYTLTHLITLYCKVTDRVALYPVQSAAGFFWIKMAHRGWDRRRQKKPDHKGRAVADRRYSICRLGCRAMCSSLYGVLRASAIKT